MIHDLLFALWFFLPAGVANASAVVAAKLPVLSAWNAPIDGGHSWRGVRIFGDHKTWRGLVVGTVLGTIVAGVQVGLYNDLQAVRDLVAPLDYNTFAAWLFGALLGFGALAGDAVKSFFKRRANVPSGKSWFPFDQIDYIIGGLICGALVVQLSIAEYAWIFAVWFGMHLLFSYLGYLMGLKDDPM